MTVEPLSHEPLSHYPSPEPPNWPKQPPLPGRPVPDRPVPDRREPLRPPPLPASLRGPVVHPAPPAGPDPVLDRLLDERIVYVGGELDDATAHRVISQLLLLSALDPRRDIALVLNSTGGSVIAAMAVHDTMRTVPPDVATRAVGLVGDGAQLLLTAGAAGKRQVLPHARIVLRRPAAGSGGIAADAAIRSAVGEQLRQETIGLIARYSGRSVEAVEADSAAERWFTAPEAVDHGLADEVTATGDG